MRKILTDKVRKSRASAVLWEQLGLEQRKLENHPFMDGNYLDTDREVTSAYYRLSEQDMDGIVTTHRAVYIDCSRSKDKLDIDLFPNPSSGQFKLNIFSSRSGDATIRMIGMAGKRILEVENQKIKKGGNLSTFNPIVKPGIYFVSVEFGDEMKVIKFSVID